MKVVALAGGTGAAKFLRDLCRVMSPADLTIIGNTGDDLEMWGLHVSPDLDTVAYTLAGLIDETKGWGVRDDTFHARARLAELGAPTYFALGDRDLAVHLFRTERLRAGKSLSSVTRELSARMGVDACILPMSNDRVATRIRTPAGWLDFQEFFVRERCRPDVIDVTFAGAERAAAAPEVMESIGSADGIIICPSNPVSSIGPILAVPGIREAIARAKARVVAVSPIIGTAPVSGPAGKLMKAKCLDVSVVGVATAYAELIDAMLIHESDAGLAGALEERGIKAVIADILIGSREQEPALAQKALEAIS